MISRPIISILLTLILLTTGCTSTKSKSVQLPEPDYWLTTGWQNSAPEAQEWMLSRWRKCWRMFLQMKPAFNPSLSSAMVIW